MTITLNGTTGISSPNIDLDVPLAVVEGGTGLSTPGTSGNVLTSTGTAWASTSLPGALGVGQSWQDVKTTPGRASGTAYTNATSAPIMVAVSNTRVGSSNSMSVVVNGVTVFAADSSGQWYGSYDFSFIVPVGHSYTVTSGTAIKSWAELR